jgi:hypothetical protein
MAELDQTAVCARLERLRTLYRAEQAEQARERMEDPAGLEELLSFEERVSRRLAELSALCEFARAVRRPR